VTVKRSGREGRWAEIPSPRARFALEAAFLIVVAAGAALARLSPLGIIGLMLVAWLLVALIERASSREQAKAFAGPPEEAPEAAAGRSWLFGRRRRAAPEALPSPEAALEERPSRAHVTRIEPAAEPPVRVGEPGEGVPGEPGGSPAPEEELGLVEETEVIVEKPPVPAVTRRPLELPGLEETEPEPEPEPKPEPEVVAAPVAEAPPPPPPEPAPVPAAPAFQAPPPSPAPQEWNLWELERRAREQAGDAARDEEWTALFVHLRQFASAEGVLPKEFDDLVRESFAELIQAA
jgi:hypothetical protein